MYGSSKQFKERLIAKLYHSGEFMTFSETRTKEIKYSKNRTEIQSIGTFYDMCRW